MLPLSTILGKINPLEKGHSLVPEFYLGLVIGEKKVKSVIWTLSPEGGKIISFGPAETWGGENSQELMVAADASIATAVTKLSEIGGKQPTKVILGLPELWVEGEAIKKNKLDILQEVCRKLLLKPIGFVVTVEAICHQLKKTEGGQPGAILVSLGETEVMVSLIVRGRLLGSKLVGRSNDLALDLEEGLLRFNFSEVLPSRILLFGGETLQDLEESKQRLIAYPWIGPGGSKKLNFLQLPKVEIVEPNYEVEAVISAGSREIQGEEKEIEIKTEVVPEPAMEEPVKSVETEESTEFLAEEENEKDDFPEEDFGFVKKEDILITHPQSNFSIPENVPEEDIPQEVVSKEQSFSPPNTFKKEKKVNLSKILSIFTLLIRKIVYFPVKLIKALGHLFFTKKTIFPLLIIFLTVGLAVAFFVSFVKAEVKVLAKSLTVEKEFDFTVSNKTNALDKEKMIVPAKEITAEISDDKTADVSGKKTVGDKARGEVVIYNRTEQSKTFAKGAVLKGIGGVKFVLQAEVTVASKSADLQNGVDKWGEGKVSVQAQEIGTQGNLAANSLLNFETLSSSLFLIKNPAAFSGGTSREVQAVSKEDRENLQKNLLKEMEGKAKGEIEKKLPKESSLLVESIYLKNKVDKFDHEVDDEADSLSLEEKVVYSAFYFQNSDLEVLIDKAISSAIPENYEKKTIREEKNFVVKDKAKGLYHAKVKQDFLPLLDMEKIPLALKGKTLNEGEEYLKSLSNLSGIEITFKPNFLAKLGIFPLRAKNINVFLEKQ